MSAPEKAKWWKFDAFLAACFYLAVRTSQDTAALYISAPLAVRLAWRSAVIRSGFGMRKGGRRRILSLGGKW